MEQANDTPDSSVPSIAETSHASSDDDDVTKVLFRTPEKHSDGQLESQSTATEEDSDEFDRVSLSEEYQESATGSDLSTQSVADSLSNSQAFRTADCKKVSHLYTSPGDTLYFSSNSDSAQSKDATEDDKKEEDSTSDYIPAISFCAGGLSATNQLFDIIDVTHGGWRGWLTKDKAASPPVSPLKEETSFHSQLPQHTHLEQVKNEQMSQPTETNPDGMDNYYATHWLNSPNSLTTESGADAETTVTSNVDSSSKSWERIIDSLEREVATLKEIIRADSKTILQLKSDIATLQYVEVRNLPHLENQTELIQVKAERDVLRDRELEHLGTIRALNEELNNLSQHSGIIQEVNGLRLENQLLATQIVENEMETARLKDSVKSLEDENSYLKLDLRRNSTNTIERSSNAKIHAERSQNQELQKQLESLAARILLIENGHHSGEEDKSLITADSRDGLKAGEFRVEDQEHDGDRQEESTKLGEIQWPQDAEDEKRSTHGEEEEVVEVTIDGYIITSSCNPQDDFSKGEKPPEKKVSKERWSPFCDCFPSSSSEEDL